MRRAERMLLNTTKTVSTISEELGYMNPETFIRSFKKFTQMTPAQYRRQVNIQKPTKSNEPRSKHIHDM